MELKTMPAINRRTKVFDLDRELSSTLISLGILPCKKGHGFVRDSVVCRLSHFPSARSGGGLYRAVSRLHNCTAKACESGIRNAVQCAHRSGLLLRLNDLLGSNVIDQSYAPPNLEFISLLSQYFYFKFSGLFN